MDDSMDDRVSVGSGVFIKDPINDIKIWLKNPNCCSLFRSVVPATETGLKVIDGDTRSGSIWIQIDSRNFIQCLSACSRVTDRTDVAILQQLHRFSAKRDFFLLQYIPSYVGIHENEIANILEKQGTTNPLPENFALTFIEMLSIRKRYTQKNLENSSNLQLVLW